MALLIYANGLVKNPATPRIGAERNVEEVTDIARERAYNQSEQLTKAVNPIQERPRGNTSPFTGSQIYLDTEQNSDSLKERRKLQAIHVMSSPVITIAPSASINEAWNRMLDEEIDHLVLVDNNNQPVRVFSRNDLLFAGIDSQNPISLTTGSAANAVTQDTLVREIASFFLSEKLTALTVVNANNYNLMGIITRSDLLGLLVSGPNLTLNV